MEAEQCAGPGVFYNGSELHLPALTAATSYVFKVNSLHLLTFCVIDPWQNCLTDTSVI